MLLKARALILLSILVTCLDPISGQVALNKDSQSLDALRALSYFADNGPSASPSLGYSELFRLLTACEAYAKGLDALLNFREPILTRGEAGISVYKKVSPSVVMVVVANLDQGKVTDSALGTGVVIDTAGHVLTNWHVINGFESGIMFLKPTNGTEPDENKAYGMEVVGWSEQADLALLKIVKPPAGLPAVELGDASAIQVAEDIHIIGHPHAKPWSYSTGVVSQIRDNYDWQYEDGSNHHANVLQMQTAINPGNSGGPVLDNAGRMLGLVAMSEEGQNLDYAVEIDVVKSFVRNALAQQTRGPGTKDLQPRQYFTARTSNGESVQKTVYAGFVSYTLRDDAGRSIEEIVETSRGTVLTGKEPNAFGGFSKWTFTTTSGRTITVDSSGAKADLLSAGDGQLHTIHQ
jgi:S1-C subfamily serine protease